MYNKKYKNNRKNYMLSAQENWKRIINSGNPYRDPKSGQFTDAPFSKKMTDKGSNRKRIDEAKKGKSSGSTSISDSDMKKAEKKAEINGTVGAVTEGIIELESSAEEVSYQFDELSKQKTLHPDRKNYDSAVSGLRETAKSLVASAEYYKKNVTQDDREYFIETIESWSDSVMGVSDRHYVPDQEVSDIMEPVFSTIGNLVREEKDR